MKRLAVPLALALLAMPAMAAPRAPKQEPVNVPDGKTPITGKRSFPFNESMRVTKLGRRVLERPITFIITDNLRIEGHGGCNGFSATAYPLVDGRLVIGPIAATRKACGGRTLEEETFFFRVVRSMRTWKMSPDARGVIFSGPPGNINVERGQ